MAHISNISNKAASNLAKTNLEYKIPAAGCYDAPIQCPLHQRIQEHAKLLNEQGLGYFTYLGPSGRGRTMWQGSLQKWLVDANRIDFIRKSLETRVNL